ncbi:ABC transporter substrate-binding protein [Pseudomonas bijieensis]|uniref:ABC transporter substrate-binding protein n=1 Tax=Pseudomonas bijieensis TaxID=2681983 RepID=UPI001E3C2F41|nr:ABC transporter substrate-binding protein [Pseudomonas bijieensis]MCD9114747.1 ABC transporter substrate-binding protein [Pseudomonas bijieensis]
MISVRVMLEYFHPWPNSAGLYLARERGWYQEAGLDVELVVHDPWRGDTLDHLLSGAVHFGVFPSNRLLVRRSLGQPLRGVAAINHRGLESIQTLTDSGIQRPRDLVGRRLALNPTPRGLAMVRHLVRVDGGDPDALILVNSGTRELRPEQLAAGVADASFGGYWAWEALMSSPVEAERRVVWPVDELGAPAYHSYLLGAHERTLETQPELTRAFLAATARGYLATAADPASALQAYETVTPYFPRELLAESLQKIAPTWLHEGAWGRQRDELLKPYAHWLQDNGVLDDAEAWCQATSNAYLPETV